MFHDHDCYNPYCIEHQNSSGFGAVLTVTSHFYIYYKNILILLYNLFLFACSVVVALKTIIIPLRARKSNNYYSQGRFQRFGQGPPPCEFWPPPLQGGWQVLQRVP